MKSRNRDWQVLRDTLRLDEVMQELGIDIAREDGKGELWASCPLPSHGGGDKNPSFSINAVKQVYNCWGCGGGDIPTLVMILRGCEYDEAISWLTRFSEKIDPATEAFVRRIEQTLKGDRKPKLERRVVLPRANPRRVLPFCERACDVADWWEGRYITPQVIAALKLGYDPLRTPPKGWPEYAGPAVLIPHLFGGKLVGWQERYLDYEKGWAGPPKYTASLDFPKSTTLYNYDLAVDNKSEVFVVESALTVARLMSVGLNAVASFGAGVNETQLRLLRRLHQGVIIAYDNDEVGREATRRTAEVGRAVPTWVLAPPGEAKADLGDLDDDALLEHIQHKEPYFTWFTNAE